MKLNIDKILLTLTSFAFIYPVNIISNLYLFDVTLILYIFYNIKFLSFNDFLKKVIVIGSGGIFISFIFIFFSRVPLESFLYLIQLLFSSIIIPIFLTLIIKKNLFNYFLKYLFYSMVFLIFLILLSFINKVYTGTNEFLYISYAWGTLRLTIGSFLPADINHYFVFSLFLSAIFFKNKIKQSFFTFFTFLLFMLTQSKTMVLTMLFYLIKNNIKLLLVISILLLFIIVKSEIDLIALDRVMSIFTSDYSGNGTNATRIHMYRDVLINMDKFVFFPVYNNMDNFSGYVETTISSTHNIIFSIIANLGIFSFLFYFISIFLILIKLRKKLNWITTFIFLDLLTLMINPIMTMRIAWLPMYIYIYYFKYEQQLKRNL